MPAAQQTTFNNSCQAQCCIRSLDSVYNLLIFQEISNECGQEFVTNNFFLFFPLYIQSITDLANYDWFFYWQNNSTTWTLLVLTRMYLPFTVGFYIKTGFWCLAYIINIYILKIYVLMHKYSSIFEDFSTSIFFFLFFFSFSILPLQITSPYWTEIKNAAHY